MKTFKSYLMESSGTYDFKVKIACDITEDEIAKIKTSLEEFKVNKFKKSRTLPIQETPEFPQQGPVEVKLFDVSLEYPVNAEKIHSTIMHCGCVKEGCLKVISANNPYNAIIDGLEVSNVGGKEGEAVLTQEELKASKVDAISGQEYLDKMPSLIKELQAARKYEYPDAAGGKTSAAKTSGLTPDQNKSPVGSNKNSIPSPRKGK
jgi:hypothetical protein